jgi:hypothetical protein
MKWSNPSPGVGALIGASVGVALAAVLVLITPRPSDSEEAAALVTAVFGAPVSLVLLLIPWFGYLSNWIVLALTAIPLNGLVLGALVGAGARGVRWDSPAWPIAVPAVWVGVAILVTLLESAT